MPQANRIWTIKDIAGEYPSADNDDGFAFESSLQQQQPFAAAAAESSHARPSSSSTAAPSSVKCCHMDGFFNSDYGQTLLERILTEFQPIIEQRKYNVRSVSEFCCCGDGLDSQLRRKKPKQSNNLLGYNQTSWMSGGGRSHKSHTIHLRLRHPANHNRFFLYEDVAGTMAHELAHCEIAPHNAEFNKLMDSILEQHAVLMASKLTRNGMPLPAFGGGNGRALGAGSGLSLADSRKQQQQAENNIGRVLGGDSSFKQWMTPREAAIVAAETRRRQDQLRLRGDRCCRPCLDTDESNEGDNEVQVREEHGTTSNKPAAKTTEKKRPIGNGALSDVENRKPPAKKNETSKTPGTASKEAIHVACIDLTGDDDDDAEVNPAVPSQASARAGLAWPCGMCTFSNLPEVLVCGMCYSERSCS
jgi:hypothetical protein